MDEHADIAYLKQYVRLHPDNRMAWYLLGRAYMQQGKEAKANYCFLQAGDIYEAYERKRHPLADTAPLKALEEWNHRRQRRRLAKRAVLLAVMLIGLSAAAPAAPDARQGADPTAADASGAATGGSNGQPVRSAGDAEGAVRPVDPTAADAQRPVAVHVVDPAAASPVGEALEALLYGARLPARGIAVKLAQHHG